MAAFVVASPGRVVAEPRVEEALRSLGEADFDRAERAFAEAEASGSLQRADLIQLLEGRAVLSLALHRLEALEQQLLALASIDPEHVFAPGRPPDLAQGFVRVRARVSERLRLEVASRAQDAGVRIEARVLGDPAGLARRVRIRARVEGQPDWREASADALTIARPGGARVEYEVQAIGPGGAVLASEAALIAALETRVTPLTQVVPSVEARRDEPVVGVLDLTRRGVQPTRDATATPRRTSKLWLWATIAGVVVAAVTAGALIAFVRTDETSPGSPTIAGF